MTPAAITINIIRGKFHTGQKERAHAALESVKLKSDALLERPTTKLPFNFGQDTSVQKSDFRKRSKSTGLGSSAILPKSAPHVSAHKMPILAKSTIVHYVVAEDV